MSAPLRIGTRGSRLALWQAEHVRALLASRGVPSALTIIKTQGDRVQDLPFGKLEGKGFFTKELEDAQLRGVVDLAVHSLKDLPTESPAGLLVAALVGREDPRDILIARPDALDPSSSAAFALRAGAVVGTSSARRRALLATLAPELRAAELRGNVPTRVGRLREAEGPDAIILAAAGVRRLALDLSDLAVRALPVATVVPAPGQGMLGLQVPEGGRAQADVAALHAAQPAAFVEAERVLLHRLQGGCQLPFGCHIGAAPDGAAQGVVGHAFIAPVTPVGDAPRPGAHLSCRGATATDVRDALWEAIQPHLHAEVTPS